ncbi:hypothetical protein [Oricola sp.]|uniref:hypothetical protein n=1 Tax=Oricola sp. TaxID=1979950 RepID=UPI003BAB47E1
MSRTAKLGAAAFFLWGVIHVIGGGVILARLLESPEAGFAIYRTAAGGHDALAGAILGYFAFGLLCLGAAVAVIAVTGNWKNSARALTVNTAITGLTEVGLVVFLLVPGHLGLADAMPGLATTAIGIIIGGIACRAAEAAHAA